MKNHWSVHLGMTINLGNGKSVDLVKGELVLHDPDWMAPKAISPEHVAAILAHFDVVENDGELAVVPKIQEKAA